MNIDIKNEKIYLDANFLIYWFISKKPELRKRARCLLAEFLVGKNELCCSALTFDEAWYGIRKEYNQQNCSELSCNKNPLFEKLENFTKTISLKVNVIQFGDVKKGIFEALNNVKKFGLRPRDAFHLAIMRDNDLDIIVTDDNDFIRNRDQMDLFVVSIS